MTLKTVYLACIISLSLLSPYYLYWGIITFKYRQKANDLNTTFCNYMFDLTNLEKWKNREDSAMKKYYNSKAYSIYYLVMSVIQLVIVVFFVIFLIKMGHNELGSQLLNFDILTK